MDSSVLTTARPTLRPVPLASERRLITFEALQAGGFLVWRRSGLTAEMEPLRAVSRVEELFEAIREAFAE